MKFSLTHLPEQVQIDLKHIAAFLVRQTIPAQDPHDRYTPSRIRHIILHGDFTEDHWTPETILHPDMISYSYNLMVIVSAHLCDILPSLKRAVEQLNQSGKVSFPVLLRFADTKGRIDRKLRNGYLAYDEIQDRGIVIYSKGDITKDLFQLPERPAAAEHLVRAQGYYDHTYLSAELFLSSARNFAEVDRNAAAFMLNVSAAQAYEAFMVVHILKYALARSLNDLRELAESIHPELAMVWTGLQGEQTFDHLSAAFRDVRFSACYRVSDNILNAMFGYVEDLHKLVHHICKLKFEALKAGSLAKPKQDWLKVVRQALKPPEDSLFDDDDEDDDDDGVQQTTVPDPSPILRTTEQASNNNALSAFLRDLDGACSELYTLADILLSLTDITAGVASSCEFALISQFLQERTRKIVDIHDQMATQLEPSSAMAVSSSA